MLREIAKWKCVDGAANEGRLLQPVQRSAALSVSPWSEPSAATHSRSERSTRQTRTHPSHSHGRLSFPSHQITMRAPPPPLFERESPCRRPASMPCHSAVAAILLPLPSLPSCEQRKVGKQVLGPNSDHRLSHLRRPTAAQQAGLRPCMGSSRFGQCGRSAAGWPRTEHVAPESLLVWMDMAMMGQSWDKAARVLPG